jgi:hypothetical protein
MTSVPITRGFIEQRMQKLKHQPVCLHLLLARSPQHVSKGMVAGTIQAD